MKKIIKISALTLMVPCLCACDLFSAIRTITGIKPEYENYEEFFEKGMNYTRYTNYADAKENIYQTLRYWDSRVISKDDGTSYTIYEAPNSETLSVYNDYIYIYTTGGITINYTKGNSKDDCFFTVTIDNKSMSVDLDNHKYRKGDMNKDETKISDEHKAYLDVYPDDSGYLVVVKDNTIFYLASNLKDIYVNDEDTNTFHLTKEKSITVPTSEVLTNALQKAKNERIAVYLPEPTHTMAGDYWCGYKYYDIDTFGKKYEDRDHHISWTTVYLPGVEAYTYAEDLKNAGFEISRANDEDIMWTTGLKYDVYWIAVDPNEQYKVTISDTISLYTDIKALFTDGPAHSTQIWIDRIGGMNSSISGRKRTTDTEWSAADDARIKAWPGTNGADWLGIQDGIPFWPLGEKYHVPTTKTYAYTGLYSNLVELGVKCYNIYDDFYINLLDGYGEVLEANGYVKYQLPDYVNVDDYNTVYEWFKEDDHKFYNAYINEEKDIAIRFTFDYSYGNLIRVFQASKVRGWDPTTDPDTTDYTDDY